MERHSGVSNAAHTRPNGQLAARLLRKWRQAVIDDGVSCLWQVDVDSAVRYVDTSAGSGFPYPRAGGGIYFSDQNGAQYPQHHRKTSFNKFADTLKT